MSKVFLSVLLIGLSLGEDLDPVPVPKGANVCIEQIPEHRLVNVTSLQSREVKEYKWCLKIPPRCPEWRTKMVTVVKQENITRIINKSQCCQGYRQTGEQCLPVCSDSCLHGECVEPEVCSCTPGFSGPNCAEVGCPGGNWGPDCTKTCPCKNGGRCEPHTGVCQCLPGWEGLHCQNKCDRDHYGSNCEKECNCEIGQQCHHVTGDCSPCQEGKYGMKCSLDCDCSSNGTALCYHVNGNCYCKSNFNGRKCELFCPFGYSDGICHKEPLETGTCSCVSDMYRCDEQRGCVCKDGLDCEGGTQFIDFASLQAKNEIEESTSHATNVSIIATVLLLALIICILLVVFYRRRMKRMEKDLEHRSVRYIENSVLDHQIKRNELVVTNTDPLRGGNETRILSSTDNSSSTSSYGSVVGPKNNLNMQNNLNNQGPSNSSRLPEKNVNIDRFKLGYENVDEIEEDGVCGTSKGACGTETSDSTRGSTCGGGGGLTREDSQASMLEQDELDHVTRNEFRDINVYDADSSPTKDKKDNLAKISNFMKNEKVQKSNVDMVMANTNNMDNERLEQELVEEEETDEEEMDPKEFEKFDNLNRNSRD